MKLALRPATEDEPGFCEALTRGNMSVYLAARGARWDHARYRASWHGFENLVIVGDDRVIGVLRLLADGRALEIRDLQVVPACQGQGIGSWAIQQAKSLAARRRFDLIRLRVFEENPARALYARLGFVGEAAAFGKLRLAFALPRDEARVRPVAGTTSGDAP